MRTGTCELWKFIDLSDHRDHVFIALLFKIGGCKPDQHMFILYKGSCQTGLIKFDGFVCLSGGQVGISQFDPVGEGIRESQIFLQPPDPSAGVEYHSDPRLYLLDPPARGHFCKNIGKGADNGKEHDHPNPSNLVSFAHAMYNTDGLKCDCDIVIITMYKWHDRWVRYYLFTSKIKIVRN